MYVPTAVAGFLPRPYLGLLGVRFFRVSGHLFQRPGRCGHLRHLLSRGHGGVGSRRGGFGGDGRGGDLGHLGVSVSLLCRWLCCRRLQQQGTGFHLGFCRGDGQGGRKVTANELYLVSKRDESYGRSFERQWAREGRWFEGFTIVLLINRDLSGWLILELSRCLSSQARSAVSLPSIFPLDKAALLSRVYTSKYIPGTIRRYLVLNFECSSLR